MSEIKLSNKSKITLQQTMNFLKSKNGIFNEDVFTGMIMSIAYMFDMDMCDIEKIIKGNEYILMQNDILTNLNSYKVMYFKNKK